MQINISIYCFFIFQCLFWLHKVYLLFAQKAQAREKQMFVFSSFYVVTNSLWLLTITGLFSGGVAEILLIGFSLGVLAYTYFLWRNIYGLSGNNHGLIIHSLIFVFLFSRLNWFETHIYQTWEFVLIYLYGQTAALFYGGRVFIRAISKNQLDRLNQIALIVSSGILCSLPLIFFFIQSFTAKYILLNLGFFLMLIAYFKSNTFRFFDSSNLPESIDIIEQNLNRSKLSLLDWNNNQKELQLYKQQLLECLERNKQLELESKAKTKVIEQYERRSENTVESILSEYDLTPRQLETVQLLIEGKSTQEIADQLFIESSSVRCHFSAVYRKTGAHGRKNLSKFIKSQLEDN